MRAPARFKLPGPHRGRRAALLVVVLAVMLCALSGFSVSAFASGEGAGWELTTRALPTNLAPGGNGTMEIDVLNIGAAASTGPVTVTDVLPAGVTATEPVVEGAPRGGAGELINFAGEGGAAEISHSLWACMGNGPGEAPRVAGATVVTCTNTEGMPSLAGGGGNPNRNAGGEAEPNPDPQIGIAVNVGGNVAERAPTECVVEPAVCNQVTIAGGGAPTPASTADPITVSSTPSGFRFVGFDGWASHADGTLDTQAGSHPYEFTTSFDLANVFSPKEGFFVPAGGQPRDIEVNVPPGLVGDPNAVPRCTRQQLDANGCPEGSQVGIETASAVGGANRSRLYDMVPPAGVPAELGFHVSEGFEARADFAVRTGSDYGLTAHANDIPERSVIGTVFTIWGVPGDHSHDSWRTDNQGGCTHAEEVETDEEQIKHGRLGQCKPVGVGELPFLTLPTSCADTEAPTFTIRATTWQDQSTEAKAKFKMHDANGNEVGFTGCDRLGFGPSITALPDTFNADTPAGLTVEVKPPVGGLTDPNGLGSSDIQNTKVILPPGLVINAGQAAGLKACQESESGLGTENAPSCSLQSKVGTVEVETPLLKDQLDGNVFVLQSNPPHLKLLAAFSGDGVNIKLVLNVELCSIAGEMIDGSSCEAPGQLITTVANIPEFPANYFRLSFSGGAQAALDTPTQCTSYQTSADFTPWASPFVADLLTNGGFGISAGPGGGPCPSNPMPFAPSMLAGSTTDQAGGFTNFSLLLQRGDAQQRIEKLQFKEPAGLAGLISSVPLCGEANANAGTCPEASHIGHAVVTSGPGLYPLVLPQPGEPELPIYLTGPYKGAPFGLAIVTPVIAGPFNLGTIITRAKIEVDPHTAQITITTDPLPQIVDGVPTDLRSLDSVIDRPGFLFNPTNCNGAEFTGTATSAGGAATAPLSSHFGVGSCQSLKFTPKVSVTTGAKSSKANGASLLFKISYPAGAMGTQSWFNEAQFDIPKQLPARLTTIQKACLARVFAANPAACPAASLIGHAIVHTAVLPVALSGPVYFVSHGGAKFPDAVLVLQGDGVTVDLVGETFINGKTGVTSATFRDTPDVPFESIEVSVPSGPFSEFAANLPAKADGSFCAQKLVMPTLFKAQNGLELHLNTRVGVNGCVRARTLTRAQKLARAMKACKKKPKHKRAVCATDARRKYGRLKRK
jgi:uncharacterized repeat protein (TIGR01451 family)